MILLAVLVALLIVLQQRLWFGKGGQAEVDALSQQVQAQQHANTGLQQRNAILAAEVKDLKSGEAAIEERARNELGMIKPGETFYRVVDTPQQATQPQATQPQADQSQGPARAATGSATEDGQ